MTAIVGVEYNGHVFIGGDRYTYGEYCHTLSDPKVRRIEPLVFGSAGDLAQIQKLHRHLELVFKKQTPNSLSELMEIFWEHLYPSSQFQSAVPFTWVTPQELTQRCGAGSAPKGVSTDTLDQLVREGQELRKAFDKNAAPMRNITGEDLKRR